MRFKVGDTVRVVNNPYRGRVKVGEVATIIEIASDQDYRLANEQNPLGVACWYEDENLEPVSESKPVKSRVLTLPTDSEARKHVPMLRGCMRYFPAALAGVANTSKLGNDKHNPGEEMHHARSKSTDQGDCVVRHLMDTEDLMAAYARGDKSVTPEMILIEVNQLAWRALAYSQEIHEKFGAPLAPGAKLTDKAKK